MGEEEAEKNREPVKNTQKDGKDIPISLEEKRVIFGQRLRNTREQLNQTKKDVIHLTRISPPFIEALEEGNFNALPGEVFGRGFVKNICKVLEIDSTSLLEEYNQCWEHKQAKAKTYGYSRRLSTSRKDHKSKKSLPFTNYFSPKGILLWVLGPVLVLAITFLVFFSSAYFDSGPNKSKSIHQDPVSNSGQIHAESGESKSDKIQEIALDSSKNDEALNILDDISGGEPKVQNLGLNTLDPNPNPKTKKPEVEQASVPPEANRPTVAIEIAPKGLSLGNKSQHSSFLMVFVKENTTIKHRFDQDSYESKEYQKGLYKFKFKEKIDLFCNDMSKLEITFKGRKLGDFGINRDAKQLSFIGNPPDKEKL
ncbi:MAG: helix-turn-helix domain-containing protein [Oligoflexales bacterium]